MKKLFQQMEVVEELLRRYPQLRDNDERLMANIWAKYIGKVDLDSMSSQDLLSALAKGVLPSYESISRCRRKLQEHNADLRGDKWRKRHDRAQEIKKAITKEPIFAGIL